MAEVERRNILDISTAQFVSWAKNDGPQLFRRLGARQVTRVKALCKLSAWKSGNIVDRKKFNLKRMLVIYTYYMETPQMLRISHGYRLG